MPETSSPLRVVFMGTPDFSAHILEGLLASGYQPLAVYTQPDRPAGRGRKATAPPVKQVAEGAGIPVHQPESLRDTAAQHQLAAYQPDVIVVVAYGLILPQEVLDIPPLGCINVHASLLPRWRGAAPIQRAIEAGDSESGVCLMQMEAGLDTGPVLASQSVPLTPSTSGGSLHDQLSELGRELLLSALPRLNNMVQEAQIQDNARATYAAKLSKSDSHLNFQKTAHELERKVRAFNPWPVAWFELDGHRFRVWEARVAEQAIGERTTGTVIMDRTNGLFAIVAAEGLFCPTRLQAPGKKPIPIADWLNGQSSDRYNGMQAS